MCWTVPRKLNFCNHKYVSQSISNYMSDSTKEKMKRTAAPPDLLSFEKNAEAFIHRGLILSSIGLALFQCLYGAELSCESLKQGLLDMEGLEHPFVD